MPEPTAPHFPPPPPDAVPAGVPEEAAPAWNPIPGGPIEHVEPEVPNFPPPPRRRPRWLPLLITALTLGLIASGLFVADQVGRPEAGRTVNRYLPADGASWAERIDRVTPNGTQSDTAVTESAIITGSAITGATDWTLNTRLIGAANSDPDLLSRGRYWRTTTTVPTRSATEAQRTKVYRAEQDLALMVESSPTGGAFAYYPNLIELPADAAPGQTWTSSGNAGGPISYTAAFRAEAAPNDCLAVTGDVTYTAPDLQPVQRQLGRTWCPGLGLVAATERGAEQLTITRLDPPPALPAPDTTDRPIDWTPTDWKQHVFEATSVDPTFGSGPISGTPSGLNALTRSGVLLRGTTSARDIIGFTAATSATWQSRWRVHPGGTILTLTAYGDAFLTTTSLRTVVGYGADGTRRWSLSLPEVVLAPPVRASDTEAVLVTLGGEVTVVEIATGRIRWRVTPGSDIGVGAAVAAGNVLVADRARHLVALRAADGAEVWREEEANAAIDLAGSGDQLMLVGDADVDSFGAVDGAMRWRAGFPDSASAPKPTPFAGGVVALTSTGAMALDGAGRTRWVRGGVYGLSVGGDDLVCWASGQAEVLGPDSATLTRFAIPEQTLGNTHQFLVSPEGAWLLDSSWSVRRYSRD